MKATWASKAHLDEGVGLGDTAVGTLAVPVEVTVTLEAVAVALEVDVLQACKQ